jgi:pilus assembly protein Flp/PilA
MLKATIKAFLHEESGATAIEYALLAGLIGVAIVGTFAALGNGIETLFDNGVVDTLKSQVDKID